MAIQETIVVFTILLMLILILLLFLIACKPWRFFLSSSSSRLSIKGGELERPLVSEGEGLVGDQSNDLTRNYDLEGACYQNEGLWRSPHAQPREQGLVHNQKLPSVSLHATHGENLVEDVISDTSEDLFVGQTLKRSTVKDYGVEVLKYSGQEDQSPNLKSGVAIDEFSGFVPKTIADQRSCLSLEVISGPSCGIHCSVQSNNASMLPLTLGRVSPCNVQLKDPEVSGKHAMINWNRNKLKWELADVGSLNGTLLNSQPINHPDPGSRQRGNLVELTSGDVITLGTTSRIHVHITYESESQIPFGVGVAADPMALRLGARKFPMEDVYYYQWPLPGVDKFGLFGICDGHGGFAAAVSASELLPKTVATLLADSIKRHRVLSQCDASDILRDAFIRTEASLNYQYEGCTATLLLVWADGESNFFAQCANVGDSFCVMNVDGEQINMSEDHRLTSYSERLRIQETGEPLKDGETRLLGLNLARMLGDKFLKEQDARFSAEPYISQVVHINQASKAFALIASDGFWDVVSFKKAIRLALEVKEKYSADKENSPEKIAKVLLNEARTLRSKDNTSIIFIDFDNRIS